MTHPYHCFLCGSQLEEAGIGTCICPKCNTFFIPFVSEDGFQTLESNIIVFDSNPEKK